MIQLRPYQQQIKQGVLDAWADGSHVTLAVCPTGGGKSLIMSDLIMDGDRAGMVQCVAAHRQELVSQMSLHVARRGIKHRIIASKNTIAQITREHRVEFNGRSFVSPDARCAVASVQTLSARQESIGAWAAQVNRFYGDEGHHYLNRNTFGAAHSMFAGAQTLLVTATPSRADGMGLGSHADGIVDEMVAGPSMRWLIDNGALADYEIACPESDLVVGDEDFATSGDLSPKKGRLASKQSHIVGDVVEEYRKRAFGKRAICFATDVETAGEMAANFSGAGIAAASISAKTPENVRYDMIQRFKNGRLQVLVNVDLFGEGFDCLDTETEILTPNGWVNWVGAAHETHCYGWDAATGQARTVPIQKYGTRPLRDGERMLTIESQHTDIRVTEGHRMFFKDVNHYLHRATGNMSPETKVCTAEEIFNNPRRFALPLCGDGTFPGAPLSDDEIRIVGWYMTDGYLDRGDALEISQVKQHHIVGIRGILDRLGWGYRETERTMLTGYKPGVRCTRFRVPRREISHLLPYMDKRNPSPLFHDMTRDQFRVLWDAMMDGNGSNSTDTRAGYLCTMHKGQADVWAHMAAVRGFATMYGTYQTQNDITMYNMRIRDKQWMQFYQRDPRGARFDLSEPPQRETVWCVQNELGTLITRRRGKIVVLGNCPACEVVIMARPTQSLAVYMQQFGRALRPAPGKTHGLIIDHVSNWKRHGLPDKPRTWTLDRRDKRAKKAPDPDDIPLTSCRECSRPYERVLPACPYCGAEPPLPDPRARTIEQVDGDLMLLDRAKLAEMRAAMILEAPADMETRVAMAAGPVAGAGARNRQMAKIGAQTRLREAIEQWAGIRRHMGETDQMIHRRFWHATGMDVMTALAADRDRGDYESMSQIVEGWYNG